jgi:membrane-bound serine protease (ClpP class)
MVNEVGVAHTALAPGGKVFIHGEYWDALSSAPVESGAKVRVRKIEGMTLRVEPANSASAESHGAGGSHG